VSEDTIAEARPVNGSASSNTNLLRLQGLPQPRNHPNCIELNSTNPWQSLTFWHSTGGRAGWTVLTISPFLSWWS